MLIRLIFWTLVIYFVIKLIRQFFLRPDKTEPSVLGKQKNEPLDLSDLDVEDAKFEEIKKK